MTEVLRSSWHVQRENSRGQGIAAPSLSPVFRGEGRGEGAVFELRCSTSAPHPFPLPCVQGRGEWAVHAKHSVSFPRLASFRSFTATFTNFSPEPAGSGADGLVVPFAIGMLGGDVADRRRWPARR